MNDGSERIKLNLAEKLCREKRNKFKNFQKMSAMPMGRGTENKKDWLKCSPGWL